MATKIEKIIELLNHEDNQIRFTRERMEEEGVVDNYITGSTTGKLSLINRIREIINEKEKSVCHKDHGNRICGFDNDGVTCMREATHTSCYGYNTCEFHQCRNSIPLEKE